MRPGRPAPGRPAAWLVCLALACCGGPGPVADPGMQLAERGIGGTGGAQGGVPRPLPAPAGGLPTILPRLPPDRGIGGTGLASLGTAGTGIAGTITGFGSIFVNGVEVGLGEAPRITIDGSDASLGDLRVGQVAVLSAGPVVGARSSTDAVVVRHEVAGQVAGTDGDDLLDVAGQQVRLSSSTLGVRNPHAGDWVAVSGLRNEAGEIAATRLDPSARGRVIVHGTIRSYQGLPRIGALPVEAAPGMPLPDGRPVSVSGREVAGVLRAETLAPDLLVADPAAFFGPGVRYFLIETYARGLEDGGIELEHGPRLSGRPSAFAPASPGAREGRSVVGFERGAGGALVATSMHHADRDEPARAFMGGASGPAGAPVYMPAPVPGPPGGASAGPGFMGGRHGGPMDGLMNPGARRGMGGPGGLPPPPVR